jgi:hypothetical protein
MMAIRIIQMDAPTIVNSPPVVMALSNMVNGVTMVKIILIQSQMLAEKIAPQQDVEMVYSTAQNSVTAD